MSNTLKLTELAFLQLITSEVKRRNMTAEEGHYKPSASEIQDEILMNQHVIMLMLYELLTKQGQEIHDLLESHIKYNQEEKRWVYDH